MIERADEVRSKTRPVGAVLRVRSNDFCAAGNIRTAVTGEDARPMECPRSLQKGPPQGRYWGVKITNPLSPRGLLAIMGCEFSRGFCRFSGFRSDFPALQQSMFFGG